MIWDETTTPLSAANLNDLETRISNALTSVDTGKTNIYNALVAKGVTPGTQAFADLVTAINSMLVPSGDAMAADVLDGKGFSKTGSVGLVGTMPDRSGDTAALALTRSGTTVKLKASDGYRDGTNDYVTHDDANDLAGNIKKGVTIRGQLGTYNNIVFSAGDVVQVSDPLNITISQLQGSYIAAARINVTQKGVYRVSYQAYDGETTSTKVRLRVVNGSTYTERLMTFNVVTYTDDITVPMDNGVIVLETFRSEDDGSYFLSIQNLTVSTLENTMFKITNLRT